MPELNLADIQGLIMRSYSMPCLRTFVLSIDRADAAKRFLGGLVSGEPSDGPQLATAAPWAAKPDYCVNLSLTYAGLQALRIPSESLQSFPEEFVQGAITRADLVGDVGANAPKNWKPELAGADVHVLVFVFSQRDDIRQDVGARLRAAFTTDGAMTELAVYDATSLPGGVVHFGYKDGFSQLMIDGGLPTLVPGNLAKAQPGEFLLGYESQFSGFTYPVPAPNALGQNGSFVAFRMLEQNCGGFEAFLQEAPVKYSISGELLAAKICGRWRNGVPLTLSPDTDSPNPPIPLEKVDMFDYTPTPENPGALDDRKGYVCPIGSHIRRNNPRNSMIAGNSGLKHRIVRRGLPYGPPYDPANPNDGKERGLMGLFIGVSLKDQFEFLMKDWVNKGDFAPGISGTKDVFLGENSDGQNKFLIPVRGKPPIVVSGFPQFVTTRGGAYGFLPSVTAMKHLAALPNTMTVIASE